MAYRKYHSIYNSKRYRRRRNPLWAIVLVVGAAALVFIGYSIQQPLVDLFTGKFKPTSPSSSTLTSQLSSSQSSSSQSSKPVSSAVSSSSSNSAQSGLRGIYLTQNYLSDSAALDSTLTAAKQAGVNLAIVELKAETGVVGYASKVTGAQGQGIIAQNAPDAATAAKAITNSGMTPAAKISCFKDPLAPQSMLSASVLYAGNHAVRWLDASNNRWLNPYSDLAQQYIIDLAKEAVQLGYKQIYLSNVEFPTGTGQAYFGDNLISREDALKAFVTKVSQQVSALGAKVSVMVPGTSATGLGDAQTGQNQSIYDYASDYVSPNLSPAVFGKNAVTIGGTAVASPDSAPGDLVSAAAQYLKTQAGAKLSQTLPFIQASGTASGSYRPYSAAEINAEITALKNAGIENFIFYSPGGSYSLSGVNSK